MRIRQFVESFSLPQLVSVENDIGLNVNGNEVSLKQSDQLLLLKTIEVQRVMARDDHLQFCLPINGEQVYERLPTESVLDDQLFTSIRQIIELETLPDVLRAIDSYCFSEACLEVDSDEILEVRGVDRHPRESALLVRTSYGQQAKIAAEKEGNVMFTSMPSAEFVHMSSLIKLKLPQRVRIPDTDPTRPDIKNEKILQLEEMVSELHVVAIKSSPPFGECLLSIPIHLCDNVQVKRLTNGSYENLLRSIEKSLFTSVNFSYNVKELCRPTLPANYLDIPRPLDPVLDVWLDSFHGRKMALETCGKSEDDRKSLLRERQRDIECLQAQLKQLELELTTASGSLTPPQIPPPRPPPRPNDRQSRREAMRPPIPPKAVTTAAGKEAAHHNATAGTGGGPSESVTTPPSNDLTYAVPNEDDSDDDYSEIDEEFQALANMTRKCKKLEKNLQESQEKLQEAQKRGGKAMEEYRKSEKAKTELVQRVCQLEKELEIAQREGNIYCDLKPPPPSQYEPMTVGQVAGLLAGLNLAQYVQSFQDEGVDGSLLVALNKAACKDLGMNELHAIKLLRKVGVPTN